MALIVAHYGSEKNPSWLIGGRHGSESSLPGWDIASSQSALVTDSSQSEDRFLTEP